MKTTPHALCVSHPANANASEPLEDVIHPEESSTLGQQLGAVGWILFAWIVGTIVFELNVMGAESNIPNTNPTRLDSRKSMLQQIDQREQDFAITHAGIDHFMRMERDSKLRPVFDAVIVQANAEIAKREQFAEAKRIANSKQTKQVAEDEANKLFHQIKQVVHSFQEFMVPVRVAQVGSERSSSFAVQKPVIPIAQVRRETSASPTIATVRGATARSRESGETDDVQLIRIAVKPVVVPPWVKMPDEIVTQPPAASALPTDPQIMTVATTEIDPNSSATPEPLSSLDPPTVSVPTANAPTVNAQAQETSFPSDTNLQEVRVAELDEARLSPPSATTTEARDAQEHVAARWSLNSTDHASVGAVSLNVDQAEVRGVIEMLARGYQMNILVAPDVTGTVTANVDGLTPEQALHGITKMCNLNLQRDGDLIYVYPDSKLPAEARELQVFQLDFVSGETIEPIIQGLLSPVGDAFVTKSDSEDNRRSVESIVVVDLPEVILQVEQFIRQTDLAPRQVMIEANILEVVLSDDMRHGVNFGSILGGDLTVGGMGFAQGSPTATNPLFFAQIDGSKVDSLIDILQTTTDSKTLASPRVQVINGQNARIQVGEQLGYKVAAATQTAVIETVEFLDTGVVLTVTPIISSDNRILLKVKPEVSDGKRDPELGIPEKTTREVDTSVLLENHQGLVIGGLIREKDETVIRKLPWLGNVRHIGKLFQRREAVRSRTEIVIALTCHIVESCACVDKETINLERSTERLFQGQLLRNHRPWESRLPDSAGETNWMDVDQFNQYIP